MKIYTKKGDSGETGLFGGERVPKDSIRIQAYGTLDELNAWIGAAILYSKKELQKHLIPIQSELFSLGAEMATPKSKKIKTGLTLVGSKETERLEKWIDAMTAKLKPLSSFVMPGGCESAVQLHLARVVARRAEREVIAWFRQEQGRPEVVQYLNRLSDALFVAARYANHLQKVKDVPWVVG